MKYKNNILAVGGNGPNVQNESNISLWKVTDNPPYYEFIASTTENKGNSNFFWNILMSFWNKFPSKNEAEDTMLRVFTQDF